MNRLSSFKSENKNLKRRLAELEALLKKKDEIIQQQERKLGQSEKTNTFLSKRMEDVVRSTQSPAAKGGVGGGSAAFVKPAFCHGCKITLF
ncbi:UNVERIFIED_CONTAM: hypothetical protein HDU68_009090 [Siphonaria sp. JEL0065]|nr:hypothetical protein HDU68_009089 [Siphonaria sp. JEL0065]KAJ3031989.1 hypothetical protein HDU68_009090 [Siphonaria sp. JEL0065]